MSGGRGGARAHALLAPFPTCRHTSPLLNTHLEVRGGRIIIVSVLLREVLCHARAHVVCATAAAATRGEGSTSPALARAPAHLKPAPEAVHRAVVPRTPAAV